MVQIEPPHAQTGSGEARSSSMLENVTRLFCVVNNIPGFMINNTLNPTIASKSNSAA